MTELFNYVFKDYETICNLARQIIQADEDDTEGIQKLNDELMKMEYNYISEDIIERKILFEVCTLNNEQTD